MPPTDDAISFKDLVGRVRSGDEAAATELVRLYEPEIRREVRLRLKGPQLRRLIDSMDICQSVLGNFFVRAALGEFDLEEPRQLVRLLVKMARNRVVDWARRLGAERRGGGMEWTLYEVPGGEQVIPGRDPTPSAQASASDLLDEFRRRLTPEERRIVDRRLAGLTWDELARETGDSAQALRKRWERGRDRVAGELDLG